MSDDTVGRRVRFYGAHDLATGWQVPRVVEIAELFDPNEALRSAEDVLELHHVQQYLELGLLPTAYTDEERAQLQARAPRIRSAVARFFSTINDTNFATRVAGVDHDYHLDLIELLGRNNAFERCDSSTALPALAAAGVHLRELLTSKKLVQAYDTQIRGKLLSSPRGAEHVVRKYLEEDTRSQVHLPASFTAVDARELLEAYIDYDDANPNYIRLIAAARENSRVGIDARLKLRAKRRNDQTTATFFAENNGFRMGCKVGVSEFQDQLVVIEGATSEEHDSRYTYSSQWLDETCDNANILNNFMHLFGFVDHQVLLTLPSYPANLGVMERVIGITGNTEYKTGVAFRVTDMCTRLQTHFYRDFLQTKGIDLEQVVAWFFESYLVEDFGAANFSFSPSQGSTSYLQKSRHLFAEMESVANQFALFVADGQVDRDLLAMGSELAQYKDIPSLLDGKYIYPSGEEINGVLQLLFSDQSRLNYISADLSADAGAELLQENLVAYDDFEDYQKPSVDHLIGLNILENTGNRVQFVDAEQIHILRSLYNTQAASYYHLTATGRAVADYMVARGWAVRRSALLTDAEGKYFNYFLNQVDFSNGPQLRNKYLHGAQAGADGDNAHFDTYITALRLTVSLVIKINDDFQLAAFETGRKDTS
ncbi:hypothetical protein [Rhodococcus tibetensis]|uniref:DUF4209 domain-containing protein n=1 Tax=Rhodococcus tibetensis TaxID=2965064 RepID=A0ABT1Q811_9NOCA|nr:hypothetical protein [Rhodococcus sp. FXJ9.536]MCQ4118382.1 hypothetical protein [Rhodococcus sp. FXJ9.536]